MYPIFRYASSYKKTLILKTVETSPIFSDVDISILCLIVFRVISRILEGMRSPVSSVV